MLYKAGQQYVLQQPYYEKNARDGYTGRSLSVKQPPVMKQPKEQEEIDKGEHIQHQNERVRMPCYGKDPVKYFYNQYYSHAINEGIVRWIYPSKSYYPDYYSKADA